MSHGAQLGTLLLNEGLITQADLDAALAVQAESGKPLGRILIEQGRISERDLVKTLAGQVGLGFVDLDDILIDTAVTMLVPESLVRRYQAIPIHYDEQGRLVVTMADPSNVFAADDIRAMTGAEVVTVVSPPSQVHGAHRTGPPPRRRGGHDGAGGRHRVRRARRTPPASTSSSRTRRSSSS